MLANWLNLYNDRRVMVSGIYGFCSGLPMMLIIGTLPYWLRDAGVDISVIGFFSWAGLTYTLKWLWSPLIDRLPLPLLSRLGRRRSWLLLTETGIITGLLVLSSIDPQSPHLLFSFALTSVVIAFFSASQDIVVDAFRIESAPGDMQGALAASYQLGYRLAMILATAGGLTFTAWFAGTDNYQAPAWQHTYQLMALVMGLGILTTLWVREPQQQVTRHAASRDWRRWLKTTITDPFADFFNHYGWPALLILALIGCYRIADIVLGIMAGPFYIDLGYSKETIAAVSKVFGLIVTLFGTFVGGVLVQRYGIMRIMMIGAILAALTNFLFSLLAGYGRPDTYFLIAVICADNMSGGVATAAFLAYLANLTNVAYSATQYAMFSALMLLLPKFLAGFSGVVVSHTSYATFFTITALLGFPVVLLVWLATRYATPQHFGRAKQDSRSETAD